MSARKVRRSPRGAVFVAALGVALTLAACGSSSSSSTKAAGSTSTSAASSSSGSSSSAAGVAAAKAYLAKMSQPPAWNGPTAPVKISAAKGKSVDIINLTQEIPALAIWANTAQAQLQAAGVHATVCDAKGTPSGITTCMQQAIAQHPNVIVALALDTKFIQNYVTQATAAGIKVITGQTGTPGPSKAKGAVAEVTFNYPQVGHILGAWFAAQSNCTGYPQIITTTSSRQPSAAEVAGIQSAITQYCPNAKPIPVQNVLIPNWPTQLPTVTRSDLTANPNLRYILPLYDGMTIYMVPAIEQAHVSHPVQMASFNATPVVMQTEVAKHTALVADVGGPNHWYAYALTDEIFRVLAGAPVVVDENVPLRLFDSSNLSYINLSNTATWYGTVNYACQYDKLWGKACS